jgi:splicing factor 3B subunit 1
LASYFKALGNIIVLMDDEVATRSAKLILPILKKDFISPDENIRRVILHVLKQCLLVNGIDYTYVKEEICNEFFSMNVINSSAFPKLIRETNLH